MLEMYPFREGTVLHCFATPGHIASTHKTGEDQSSIVMNAISHHM